MNTGKSTFVTYQSGHDPKGVNHAFGRSIHDFWLEDGAGETDPHGSARYGEDFKLWSAEWALLTACENGVRLHLSKRRPNIATQRNRIRANFLRFMALGGDTSHPLHDHGVQISGAYVMGKLDFYGTVLPENFCVENCHLQTVDLTDCRAETLVFDGSQMFELNATRLETSGEVNLRHGFLATGEARFLGAKIGGSLDCEAAHFEAQEFSLICDGIHIDGDLNLSEGFLAKSCVQILGAKVGGVLNCRDGWFCCEARSLDLQGSRFNGSIYLDRGFFALGMVDLTNVAIGTNLRCTGATFSGKGISINAHNLRVGNSLYFNQTCRVRGEISLQSAHVGDSVTFEGGSFETKGQINLRNAKISNMITWRGVEYARGELNLAGASCNSLNMDQVSWEKPAQIRLDNFKYDRFAELPKGCNPPFWRRWLERQPPQHLNEKYRPNPYQHLAMVLDNMGHEEEAREMRIESRERQRLFTQNYVPMPRDPLNRGVRYLSNFWNWVQKKVIGHGYRPGFAIIWLSVIVLMGTGIYWTAALKGIMAPTHPLIFKEAIFEGELDALPKGRIPAACRENWVYPPDPIKEVCTAAVASEYSTFSALVYSLDTAIPVVNFRMEQDWSPRVVDWQTGDTGTWWNPATWHLGWYVRTWEWIQIGLGWALSLLFVSAIGGVIRRG